MVAHTFRGSTWRSLVGLESARTVFERYRALRAREREYVDWPDPLGDQGGDGPGLSGPAPVYVTITATRQRVRMTS
jgi:hypothetical protein